MGELVGMLLLLALGIFIVWESSSKGRPLSLDEKQKGFTPGKKATHLGLLILAATAVLESVMEFNHPSLPPFTGRYAALRAALYDAAGPKGEPVLYLGLAALCVFVVIVDRRRRP